MTFALYSIKMESYGVTDLTALTVSTVAAVICGQLLSAQIWKCHWEGKYEYKGQHTRQNGSEQIRQIGMKLSLLGICWGLQVAALAYTCSGAVLVLIKEWDAGVQAGAEVGTHWPHLHRVSTCDLYLHIVNNYLDKDIWSTDLCFYTCYK